jgi:hypothetical protein
MYTFAQKLQASQKEDTYEGTIRDLTLRLKDVSLCSNNIQYDLKKVHKIFLVFSINRS